MDKQLISIIVPAYNIEPYILRCIESLQCQTHKNLEIIIVNDGSVDGTGEIIDGLAQKDSRIVVLHKENGGVSNARIAGINIAKGNYIGFVDGDDYVEPHMFEHLLKNAEMYGADISHCGYQMVFPDGHIDYYYNTGRKEKLDCLRGLYALIEGRFIEPGLWNKLYRRDIVMGFEKSLLWDSSLRINEDLLMNYILFSKAKKSVYEDIPYYHYVLRKGSAATTHTSHYKITDPIRVMRLILKDSEKVPEIYGVAIERYLRVLIGTVQQSYWIDDAINARYELKKKIWSYAKVQRVSKKVLLMAFGVAYMLPLYKCVRKVYNLFTGVDKKYNLE